MKIAIITTYFGTGIGGAEISTKLLVNALIKKNNQVSIITLNDFKLFSILPLAIKAFLLNTNLADGYIKKQIKKKLTRIKPDIVHIQDLSILPPAIAAAKEMGLKTVATVRDERFLCNLPVYDSKPKVLSRPNYLIFLKKTTKSKFGLSFIAYLLMPFIYSRPAVLRNSLRRCSLVVSVSDYIRASLKKIGIKNVKTIYNLPPNWKKAGLTKKPDKSIMIFSNGRLEYYKGFHILIKAMQGVFKKAKDLHLVIAGEGPYKRKLEKITVDLGLGDKISFSGKLEFNHIKCLYYSSDIVVLPSLWQEPLSRVILEAFKVGKPLIATDVGGTSEFVKNRRTGLLIRPGDSKAIGDAVLLLSKNKSLRSKLGKNACQFIKNYDTVSQYLKAYNLLMKGDKAGS